jgi:hypothetical protein
MFLTSSTGRGDNDRYHPSPRRPGGCGERRCGNWGGPVDADAANDPWITTLTEEVAFRAHPVDVPYPVAARVLGKVGVLLRSREADPDLVALLDARPGLPRVSRGPGTDAAPERTAARPATARRRPAARGADPTADVGAGAGVAQRGWPSRRHPLRRRAAGGHRQLPQERISSDPVVRQAGAQFTALPEFGPIAGPGIEGPA